MSEPHPRLPARPSLEQLRKQAKELLRAHRAGDSAAAGRFIQFASHLAERATSASATLADAQFVIARELGFDSWPRLKRHVDIIRRPADFDEPVWGRDTWPFLVAVYENRVDQVQAAIAANPEIVHAQYAYLQPLHYAVNAGRADTKMIELLLAAGANPLAEGWSGRPLGDDTPLGRARDRERDDIVHLFSEALKTSRRASTEPGPPPPTPLRALEDEMMRLCHRGDTAGALEMLGRYPDLAYAGLYEAVHQGHTELARILLERGADPTKPWRWECWFTPLMHALRYETPNFAMAQLLLARGAVASLADDEPWATPAAWARRRGFKEILALL